MRWIFLLSVIACSPAQKEWRVAKRANTAEAYRPIANNLSHKKRAKAYERVEQMDWDDARRLDSSRVWKAYVSHYPSSPRADEARANRAQAQWNEVVKADSRTTYERFLAQNGASPHAKEARKQILELAWKEAELGGNEEAYGRYLIRYPDGPHAAEATDRRQEKIWSAAVESDSPADYASFVERFPQGKRSAEARSILDGFKFSGVAIRIVYRELYRDDSLKTYEKQLMARLGKVLKASKFKVAWLRPLDARGDEAVNPMQGLLKLVPEDHATLVIELREKRGEAFRGNGFATDIVAAVYLVPPGRTSPMATKEVKATTGDVIAPGDLPLHLSAQRELGVEILKAGFEFEKWRR